MKRSTIVSLVCLGVLLLAAPLMAQDKGDGEKEFWPTYVQKDDIAIEPLTFTCPFLNPPWQPAVTGQAIPLVIQPGEAYWFASPNELVLNEVKNYFLDIVGTNVDLLDISEAYGPLECATPHTWSVPAGMRQWMVNPNDAVFFVLFDPQPAAEWVLIRNNGAVAVTIDSVSCYTDCRPVPALSTYGLIGLLLLLGASAVFIIRKRRLTA